jgi:N-acetylmuramoyl-L-alanine amidase
MKSLVMAWFCCAVLGLAMEPRLPASPQALERVSILGKEYVSLRDWARSHDAEVRWLRRDETLEVSHPSWRLTLSVDSAESQFNGVGVWLSAPVARRNGNAYISRLDLQTTLQPLVFPPRSRAGTAVRTICLDPGHGGRDPGNRVGSNLEKKYTFLLAREVRDLLSRAGLRVLLTRPDDRFIDLSARPELARRREADLFVSLHFNSADAGRETVKGVEVYCLTPVGASSTNSRGEGADAAASIGNRNNDRNLLLAYEVQRSLRHNLAVEDRGVRRARFEVLREATMPAVLIEGGFMSHPAEGRKIFSSDYRRQMARAIVDGLLHYKRLVDIGEVRETSS